MGAGFAGRRQCSFAGRCALNCKRCAYLVDYYCCYISALHCVHKRRRRCAATNKLYMVRGPGRALRARQRLPGHNQGCLCCAPPQSRSAWRFDPDAVTGGGSGNNDDDDGT